MSPCLANRVPKPQPTPPSKTPKKILQAYISGENSEHNHNQNELIEIYTITYQGDSCMKGIWEVLDEGVGGSLPTHLQELLPSCKGEQSLTLKETRPRRQYCCPDHKGHGSIASHRWQYQHLLTRSVSEITERFELEHQWHNFITWLFHFEATLKLEYRKPWPIAIFLSENSSLLSK